MKLDGSIDWLLVEDNPADVRLVREALRDAPRAVNLHAVEDGDEALEFLERRGGHEEAPRPDLVLLDLNLPGIDGRQVLARIKASEALREIPVVVMTTSDAGKDVHTCYALHANCYVVKPIGLSELKRVLSAILSFWFDIVLLPGTA
ncbi:MAG: response regulator [Gemmatimonadota bacterium]